jgi:hypothetical protein
MDTLETYQLLMLLLSRGQREREREHSSWLVSVTEMERTEGREGAVLALATDAWGLGVRWGGAGCWLEVQS